MVKIVNMLLFFLTLCFSCKNIVSETDIPMLTIESASLEKELKQYLAEVNVPNIKSKHPYLTISKLEADTVEYKISYFLSPVFFQYHPVAFFIKVDSVAVPVEIEGAMFKESFLFNLKESDVNRYIERYFPKEFNYYKENKVYPPPLTAGEVVWILRFKGSTLIEKRIIG